LKQYCKVKKVSTKDIHHYYKNLSTQ